MQIIISDSCVYTTYTVYNLLDNCLIEDWNPINNLITYKYNWDCYL